MAKTRCRQIPRIAFIMMSTLFLVVTFQNCGPGFQTNESLVQGSNPLSIANSQNSDENAPPAAGDESGNPGDVVIDEPPQEEPDIVINGPQLYNMHCASCHGNVNNSTKSGRTAARIANAIAIVPGMADLYFLSDEEVQAIANAIQ